MNQKNLHIILLIAVALSVKICFSAELAPPVPWIGEGWQFRQVVSAGGKNSVIKSSTGITELNTLGNVLPDGADIRVTDLFNNIIPYRVLSVSKDGFVKVEFSLAGKTDNSAFCVYYGNPSAKPLVFNFGQIGGGVNLIIKSYESGEVTDIDSFFSLFDASQKVMGQTLRENISDKSNPFSKENEKCLALYSGIIRAPINGSYGFQLKATGPAFLSIDDKVVLSQKKADIQYATSEPITLSRGDHFFKFCVLSRHPSAFITELYWRLPGERIFKIIPPESFSSSIYYYPVVHQKRGKILNAFFDYNFDKKIQVLGSDKVFTRIIFKNLSFDSLAGATKTNLNTDTASSYPALPESEIRVSWDFGDGEKSSEPNPFHIYNKSGVYEVKLTARNDMGFEDIFLMPIIINEDGAEKIELQWDVQEDNQLVQFDVKTIPVSHSYYLTSPDKKDFILRKTLFSAGKIIDSSETQLTIVPREAMLQNYSIPNLEGTFKIRWELFLYGINIMSRGLFVLDDTEKFPHVTAKDASMIDEEGNVVIVKVTGEANTTKRFLKNIFDPQKKKNLEIAVIDNSLAPFGKGYNENDYYCGRLKSLLQKKFPDVDVNIHRFAGKRDQLGYFAAFRIVSYASQIYKIDPDVIIISPDFDDLRSLIEPDFRYYAIMVHNYIANTRAKIILTTPPPRVGGSTKAFAMGVSKIALMHDVGLADIHQTVSLYQGDWKSLFTYNDEPGNVYYYDMNSTGQDIIAETLFTAIIKD